MNKPNLLLFVISMTIVFIFGTFVGYTSLNELQPIFIDSTKNLSPSQLENKNNFQIDKFVNFKDESKIFEKRNQLIHFIWNSDKLPNDYPSLVENNFSDPKFNDLENLKEIEKISITMKNGFNSYSYIFFPEQSNGKLILYHQGHSGGFVNGKNTIQSFLNSGFSVAAFSMPLIGLNNQPTIQLENIGDVKFFKHNQLVLLETDNFSSMNYFFTPLNMTLNHIDKNYSFDEYNMVGISGGGWVTTVYSAIDTRILKSFSVAGSLPFSLRTTIDDVGDYEQFNPQFYSIANYFELYVMSSFGENREFIQIFNKYDPCCFAGNISNIYHDSLNQYVSNLSSGNFDIIIDDTTFEHNISDFAIGLITEKFSN